MTIELRFPNVSARHCQLTFADGYWYIEALDEAVVMVNDHLLQPGVKHWLKSGDVIDLNGLQFVFEADDPIKPEGDVWSH